MPRRRAKVLILDGDKEACLALHRSLFDGSASYDILLATSAAAARDIMRDVVIDVLVADVDLPGSGGVDLGCWVAIEFPETVCVVQTSEDIEELQRRMGSLGCLRLLKKPCSPKDVLKIIHESLDCVHRLSGCFSALSAADLIQMLCLTQRTVALRITAGGRAGAVLVKGGQLVHATWGSLSGQEALCEILDARDGVFRETPLPDGVAPSFDIPWQQALMEAVRTLDERTNSLRRQTGSFPGIRVDDFSLQPEHNEALPEVAKTTPAIAVDGRKSSHSGGVSSSLVDRGFAALRAGNVEEARRFWLAAKKLDPENRSIDLNLRKLDSRAPR